MLAGAMTTSFVVAVACVGRASRPESVVQLWAGSAVRSGGGGSSVAAKVFIGLNVPGVNHFPRLIQIWLHEAVHPCRINITISPKDRDYLQVFLR
jgi:hypothetical protein